MQPYGWRECVVMDLNKLQKLTLRSEQLEALLAPTVAVSIAHIVAAAVILLLSEWDAVANSEGLLICFGSICVASLGRVFLYFSYRKKSPEGSEKASWEKRFLYATVLLATCWSLTSVWVFQATDEKHQFIMVLAIVGIASLSALSFAPIKSFYRLTIPITLFPTTVLVVLSGSHDTSAVGVLIFMFMLALLIGSERNHKNIEHNIMLRLESVEREEDVKRFRMALDSSADSVYIIDPERMRFLDLNETAYTSLGYTKEEMLGMGPQDIKALISTDALKNIFAGLFEQGRIDMLETVHARKDGAEIPVEIFLRAAEDNAQKKIIIASVRDISERNKHEERIQMLSKALEASAEAVIITNTKGVIEYVNPAFSEITGYSYDEAIGETPSMLKSSAQDSAVYQELWESISQGNIWSGALVDRKKDGSFYHVLMSVSPVFNHEGEITNYIANQRDVTEYKHLEEQFRQAQKMEALGTLVGGIAHDFNNMLAAITGNVYLAKRLVRDDEAKLTGHIETIHTISLRAAEMIKQMLSFSRRREIEQQKFSFKKFMEEGFEFTQKTMPENIEHICMPCEEDMIINGDPNLLQQALMNLLNNARDAVEEVSQPKIICSLSSYAATAAFIKRHSELNAHKFAKLTVEDNGCGIEKERIEKIFDPFFTTKGVGKGTGLGLAMTFGAIQSHGGVVEVDSEVGRGTSFHIYLPVVDQGADAQPEIDAIVIPGEGETVLLIDDDEGVRSTTNHILSCLNYNVIEAVDGLDGLTLFRSGKNNIDLVLTDVVMPKMGGVELANSIRMSGSKTPIVFMTGYDEDTLSQKDELQKGSMMIQKPFSVDELSQIIRKMIHHS